MFDQTAPTTNSVIWSPFKPLKIKSEYFLPLDHQSKQPVIKLGERRLKRNSCELALHPFPIIQTLRWGRFVREKKPSMFVFQILPLNIKGSSWIKEKQAVLCLHAIFRSELVLSKLSQKSVLAEMTCRRNLTEALFWAWIGGCLGHHLLETHQHWHSRLA